MIVLVLAIFGLILGSFVNAFVWRMHERESLLAKKQKPTKKQLDEISVVKGRSMCPECHHELAAKDLVPLLSWLWLHGKCRYCHRTISAQYPAVEALTALLFALSYVWWPLAFHGTGLVQFIFWLGFLVMFMTLAVYDLRWFLLPNRVVYPIIGIAVVQIAVVATMQHSWMVLLNGGLAALIISGLFYLLFQISGGNWIGGGDVKLGIVLGLLAASPLKAVLVIFFASVIGTIITLPLALLVKKGLQMKIPFGPFLLAATVIVVLLGAHIIDWYKQAFL